MDSPETKSPLQFPNSSLEEMDPCSDPKYLGQRLVEENESEEDILDEGDEEADEEHDQELEVLVQPELAVNKAPEVSSSPKKENSSYSPVDLSWFEDLVKTGIFGRCTGKLASTVESSHKPSLFKKARKPREMINHHVVATISSQSVPGQNIVLVRPRTLGQTNPKEHGPVPMEGDEEIFEEEAVCKNCFHNLKEENILKTECTCGNALIHEECAAKWSRTRGNNNCDSCGQEVQTFPVTLVRGLSSSTQVVGREESNKRSLFSRLMRLGRLEFLNIFRLLRAISAIASSNIKGATDEGHNLISIFN